MFFYIFCIFSFFSEGIQIDIYIDSNFKCTPKCDGNISSPFADLMEAFRFLDQNIVQESESKFIFNSLGSYEIKTNDSSKIEGFFKNIDSKVSFGSLNKTENFINIVSNAKNVFFFVNQVFSLVKIKFIFNENNDLTNANNQSLFSFRKKNAFLFLENCSFTGSFLNNSRAAIFGDIEILTNISIRISNSFFSNLNQTNGLMTLTSNNISVMIEGSFIEKIYSHHHILNLLGNY